MTDHCKGFAMPLADAVVTLVRMSDVTRLPDAAGDRKPAATATTTDGRKPQHFAISHSA